jgi:lysophospholipase L1-like esterase
MRGDAMDKDRSLPRQSWFEKNPKKTMAGVVVAMLVFFEVLLRGLTAIGVYPYQQYPTSFRPVFWDDIDPVVGVWRYPDATFRHVSSCFDVVYHTNDYGARDRQRTRKSAAPRRIAVLGDSFVEGYGVAAEKRFTNLLEKRTGVEHLNFGSGGGFGSIQEWLLYDHLVKEFDHTDVLIFMLPANDFADNDPAYYPADRYRPYLKPAGDGFSLYYPVPFEERRIEFRSRSETIKNRIDNAVYIANFLRWATRQVKIALGLKQAPADPSAPAFYDRFSDQDLEILLYTYRRILEAAGSRRVFLFTIPVEQDFNAAASRGYDFKLVRRLAAFADRFDNLVYEDLLGDILRDSKKNGRSYRDYTLGCDPHWGPLGHAVAADAVFRVVFGPPPTG